MLHGIVEEMQLIQEAISRQYSEKY